MACATAGLAHEGVQNPAVLARMNAMAAIGDATKVLGQMVKGQADFDAEDIRAALAIIEAKSAQTPTLFERRETDPKSEALPAIWEDFDDFRAKSRAMEEAAQGEVPDMDALRATLEALGASCKACHKSYRK